MKNNILIIAILGALVAGSVLLGIEYGLLDNDPIIIQPNESATSKQPPVTILPTQPATEATDAQANAPFVAGNVFRDRLTDGSDGPEMVWIPAGGFRMGDIQHGGDDDEQPVHSVSVDRFALGKYELTVGEYLRFVKATGHHAPEWLEEGSQYHIKTGTSNYYKKMGAALTNENHPIVGISWYDATAYVKWLSEQTGHQYILPTEAQWEYAARAGTETKYWWGNDIGTNRANCYSCDDSFQYTAPVGSFAPNPFGLYDTAGNVWEWTCSKYTDKYTGKEQQCAESAGLFVVRSSSWDDDAGWARSAIRGWTLQADRKDGYGVRPARIR